MRLWIVMSKPRQDTDPSEPVGLIRVRREWPSLAAAPPSREMNWRRLMVASDG